MKPEPTQLETFQAQRIEAQRRANRNRELQLIASMHSIPNVQPSRIPNILAFCDNPIPNFLRYKS